MHKHFSYFIFSTFFIYSLLFSGCGTNIADKNTTKQATNTRNVVRAIADATDWTWFVGTDAEHSASHLTIDIYFSKSIPSNVKNFQYFLDTDNNSQTGFSYGESYWEISGADYMIENDDLYKSNSKSNWSWSYVGTFSTYTKRSENGTSHIHLSTQNSKILNIIKSATINITIEPFDKNWDSTYSTISTQSVNLEAGAGDAETIYDDAEGGISPNWVTVKGATQAKQATPGYKNQSNAHIHLYHKWYQDAQEKWHNDVEYHLPIHDKQHKVLSVDIVGTGDEIEHYNLGAIVTTSKGKRTLLWDSFYTHENLSAKRTVYDNGNIFMVFPSPIELVRGFEYSDTYLNENFSVDLEDALQSFEPNNKILSVDTFIATGGNLDNIKLKN